MAVAGQEILQPQHVGVVGAADDDRPAGAALEQADAAQDQRAHDPLAEFGLLDQQIAQPRRRNDQRFDGLHCATAVDQRGPAGQLRQLAHEGAGPVGYD